MDTGGWCWSSAEYSWSGHYRVWDHIGICHSCSLKLNNVYDFVLTVRGTAIRLHRCRREAKTPRDKSFKGKKDRRGKDTKPGKNCSPANFSPQHPGRVQFVSPDIDSDCSAIIINWPQQVKGIYARSLSENCESLSTPIRFISHHYHSQSTATTFHAAEEESYEKIRDRKYTQELWTTVQWLL